MGPPPKPLARDPNADEREGRDLEVARLAGAGDPAARDGILARLEIVPRVLSVMNQRFGSPLSSHDLVDLVQQVFLLAWSRLGSYDGRVPLEAWAYGIARLEFLSSLRRGRRNPASLAPEDLADHPEPRALPEIDAERVRAMLTRLEPVDARLLHLRHFDGVDFEPIARELGLTVVNTRSRYYRALERLRTLYGADSEEAQA